MGYSSKSGRKPFEYASKSAHGYIINDPAVNQFLGKCHFPKSSGEIALPKENLVSIKDLTSNPIDNIVAIDGGISEVTVKKEFPSSTLTFFQFGALVFKLSDLEELEEKPFIDPEDIAELNNIQRLKFAFPTKNITYQNEVTLINSARRAIYDFCRNEPDDGKLIETLKWLVAEEYSLDIPTYDLANCPVCSHPSVRLEFSQMSDDYMFDCPYCHKEIFLTDVFRLHEAIDNEIGAGGVIAYVTTLLEQLILVHLIKVILETKPSLLDHTLFIKDGPLAFFGQTANLHKPMRRLINYLQKHNNLFLAGLEKSGSFVEHADQVAKLIPKNTALILDNDYIYKYIIPGHADPNNAYGRTTYYGNKLIYKTPEGQVHVVSIPTKDALVTPSSSDFKNLDVILANIAKLKCDMYDSALLPVALANKLISLSDHPSSVILEKFAKERFGV
jgi:hypothetical protein